MSKAEQIIVAALQHGPLFWETRAGCGWYFRSSHRRRQFTPPRRRYFRTMDVRRVLASGMAVQIGNQVVRA